MIGADDGIDAATELVAALYDALAHIAHTMHGWAADLEEPGIAMFSANPHLREPHDLRNKWIAAVRYLDSANDDASPLLAAMSALRRAMADMAASSD